LREKILSAPAAASEHTPVLSSRRVAGFARTLRRKRPTVLRPLICIRLGQHHVLKSNMPLCNLWLTLLKGLGAPAERHGDSSGLISIPG
jgi:hypothetical protein